MAKITRKQYDDFNKKCSNGFKLDLEWFLLWGFKRCTKEIKNSDGSIYKFSIEYIEKCERYECIGYAPVISVAYLQPLDSGCYSVHHLKEIELGGLEKTRKAKLLQNFTQEYTDEKLLAFLKS